MKCEFQQVVRGFSTSIQSAAASAEVAGKLTAQAVSFVEALDEELLAQCANSSEEEGLIRSLVNSTRFADQKLAAKMAAKALFVKWSSED